MLYVRANRRNRRAPFRKGRDDPTVSHMKQFRGIFGGDAFHFGGLDAIDLGEACGGVGDVAGFAAFAADGLRQRQAIYLVGYGFSHGEIAAIMGIEKCTVNKHITRARSGLKREGSYNDAENS